MHNSGNHPGDRAPIMITNLAEIPELQRLQAVLRDVAPQKTFALAYSGGVDSRFLAFAAKRLGFEPVLLHIIGPQIAPDETAAALHDAEGMGLEALCVPASSLSMPALAEAGKDRCYVCKRHLFEELIRIARESNLTGAVCDGTNASDLGIFRPGFRALKELGVRSPLAEAGIQKPRIREIGREIGLPHADQPARPCLLTRFPYGVLPSGEALAAVADAELFVSQDPFGSKLAYRIRMPEPGKTRLHVSAASLSAAAPDAEQARRELEALKSRLAEKFGSRLPDLQAEVLETPSGYYD